MGTAAGGGIRAEDGSMAEPNALDLDNMVVTHNRMTSGNGGAGLYVVAFNIDTTVKDSTFTDNDTSTNCTGCDGGAIFNRGRTLDIDNSHLDDNSAGGKAGGLWNTNGGQVTIDDSTVNDNTNNNAGSDDLDGFGGGIYQADEDSFMTITNSEVNGNTAQGRGGGIYITNGHLILDRSEVNENTLDGARDGGGIFSSSALESPPAVQIIDTTVAGNTTGRSGGGYFDNQGTNHDSLLVKGSTFSDNTATVDGGGLRIKMDATIANSTIDNNHALTGDGGGLWLMDKNLNLINDTISDNDATGAGDGLRRDGGAANDGDYFLSNTIVANNDCSADVNDNNPITEAFNEGTNNLDTGTSCGFQVANDSQNNADPDLGPLQSNGGPTFTRAIFATNTSDDAVDAGDDPTCAADPVSGIDQRHVPRPQGAACDIGAYELAATIRGMKFEDLNTVGTKDLSDPGLEGWTINAYADDGAGADDPEDGIIGPDEAAAGPAATGETDADGNYALGLSVNPVNDYVICEELQAGWTQTFPDPGAGDCDAVAGGGDEGYRETDLAVGDDFDERDFGNVHSAATVSGMKFRDVNDSGGDFDDSSSPPDEPVEGWVINAYADDGGQGGDTANDGILGSEEAAASPAATAMTAADGAYTLTLAAGAYVVCEELPADWVQSFPDPGTADCTPVDGAGPDGYKFDLASGDEEPNVNFGNVAGLVKGTKTDAADNPLEGWTICAYADDDGSGTAGVIDPSEVTDAVACEETAADGTYTIGLQAGDYVICEELEPTWTQVSPVNPKCTELPDPTADGGYAVTGLTTDETFLNNDFVNTQEDDTNTISGEKFRDVDNSGGKNAGDEPVEGWVINAYTDDGDGTLDDGTEATDPPAFSATTAADGTYSMDVDPGDYVVCEELKDDWVQS
ncbi:MAG: choice-of-anchor Q domain-containing protein, partial [Nocardioidaceae bacterium]